MLRQNEWRRNISLWGRAYTRNVSFGNFNGDQTTSSTQLLRPKYLKTEFTWHNGAQAPIEVFFLAPKFYVHITVVSRSVVYCRHGRRQARGTYHFISQLLFRQQRVTLSWINRLLVFPPAFSKPTSFCLMTGHGHGRGLGPRWIFSRPADVIRSILRSSISG